MGKIEEMKILITGAKGMLGSDLSNVLSPDYEVEGIDIEEADITDKDKIIKLILQPKPDMVMHTAAYTDVDGCEINQKLAFLVNGKGTENVALAAKKLKIPLLYISTDYVFNGEKKSPYIESDTPDPINVYGKSKLRGEEYVQNLVSNYFIIRIAGLFGKNGKNFVKTILKKAKEENSLKVVADQIHSPTYTIDLAQEIKRLIKTENYGIYHITNNGKCSWFQFAQEILKSHPHLPPTTTNLVPITSKELNRPAKRPQYSVLSNKHLKDTIGDNMPSWQNALEEYFNPLKL